MIQKNSRAICCGTKHNARMLKCDFCGAVGCHKQKCVGAGLGVTFMQMFIIIAIAIVMFVLISILWVVL